MDWVSMLVGAGVGAVVSLIVDKFVWVGVQSRWQAARQKRRHERINALHLKFQDLHPALRLVQSGWDQNGCFPESSVVIRRAGEFEPCSLGNELRAAHQLAWSSAGLVDGQQYGIKSFQIRRVSDDAHAELTGTAHVLEVESHSYSYFDFQATHVLRLVGTDDERRRLDELVAGYGCDQPLRAFPTPLSVGLSLLCEGGETLVLTRRSTALGGAGYWAAGKRYNAVGENAAERDFTSLSGPVGLTTPHQVARRGLFEEMGFSDSDLAATPVFLHTFAWASDLLDYKFFGYAATSLSFAEVERRWQQAPDRHETSGTALARFPFRSKEDCMKILADIRSSDGDWATEAAFCTIYTMIVLGRLRVDDVLSLLTRPTCV